MHTTITASEIPPLGFPQSSKTFLIESSDLCSFLFIWSPINSYECRWNCFNLGMLICLLCKAVLHLIHISMSWLPFLEPDVLYIFFFLKPPRAPFTIFCSISAIKRHNLQNVNELHFPKSHTYPRQPLWALFCAKGSEHTLTTHRAISSFNLSTQFHTWLVWDCLLQKHWPVPVAGSLY